MMDSLRGATQNTMFEQWLGATMQPTLQPKQAVTPTQQVVHCDSATVELVLSDLKKTVRHAMCARSFNLAMHTWRITNHRQPTLLAYSGLVTCARFGDSESCDHQISLIMLSITSGTCPYLCTRPCSRESMPTWL